MKDYKLKLILPKRKGGKSAELLDMKKMAEVLGGRKFGNPPLGLPTIAALTPPNFEISIIDEHVDDIDFDEKVDLVGISCMTPMAPRAYEIAQEFRKRGKKVVFGGIHPSMLPEEASKFADTIVIGEAEGLWPSLIRDFLKGDLKAFYRSEQKVDLTNSPVPRFDLLNNDHYITHTLQVSRGCPHSCEFCSNTAFLGSRHRFKPIENVIREIEVLKMIDRKKTIFICDDNITANKRYAKELFRTLIHLDVTWSGMASIDVAWDDELLELIRRSGGKQLFIGFESLSQKNLDLMNKSGGMNKVEDYAFAIHKVQSKGIAIMGGFILGCDFDDEDVFQKLVKFINNTNIMVPQIRILQVYPGTRLFRRLKEEGRILNENWSDRSGDVVTFEPKLMSKETLLEGYNYVVRELFSMDSIYKRLTGFWRSQQMRSKPMPSSLKQILHLLTRGIWKQGKEGILLMLKAALALNVKTPLSDRFYSLLVNLSINDYVYNSLGKGDSVR